MKEQLLTKENIILDELKAGRLSISEWFFAILLLLIFIPIFIILNTPGNNLDYRICMSLLLLVPLFILYPRIYRSSTERKQMIEVLKLLINYSKNSLSIKNAEKEGITINLILESPVNYYPKKVTMSFTSTSLGGYWLIRSHLKIEMDYNHILTILIFRSSSKDYFIFEDKNLEKIIDRLNILEKNEAVHNYGGKGKLKAILMGENFLKDTKKGALRILKVLEVMQTIKDISTTERPILRDIKYNKEYLPMKDYFLGPLYLATVCFKCSTLIKLWKKGQKEKIVVCPKCGSKTNEIIVPDDERYTKYKTVMMKKM